MGQVELLEMREMTPEELAVARLICRRRGRRKAVSVRSICRATGLSDRRVRQIVKHLIERHYYRIGSTPSSPPGYYIITERAEVAQVRRSLLRRVVSILDRVRVYERAEWVAELAGQIRFRLGEDEHGDQ